MRTVDHQPLVRAARLVLPIVFGLCLAVALPAEAAAPRGAAATDAKSKAQQARELKIERHLMMARYLETKENNLPLASREYKSVLRLDPKHLDAALALARIDQAGGKTASALRHLTKLSKTHPQATVVWREIARLHELAKKEDLALKAYQKAIALDPNDASSHHAMAKILGRRYAAGDAKAKAPLKAALDRFTQTTPDKKGQHFRWAERLSAELDGGDLAVVMFDAQDAYERAWDSASHGSINQRMGQARSGFERCVTMEPANQKCHFYLGMIHASVKASAHYDPAKARAELMKADKLPEAHVELAIIARKEGDDIGAEKSLRQALNLDRRNQRAWLELGIAKKLGGDDREAISAFTKAYQLSPNSSLGSKAMELNLLDPDNALVQRSLRFGMVKGDLFSSEKFKSAVTAFESRFGGVDATAPEQRVLETMLERILDAAEVETRASFRVRVLNTQIVNAFAMPNGNIYFTKGFFTFMGKTLPDRALDAEHGPMAHVLAHEIVHVLKQHVVRSQVFVQATTDATSRLDPSVLVHVTRIHEIEADREGMVLAALAGYHPRGGIEFMEARGKAGEIPPHLDHPTYDERIHYLEEYWSNDVKYAWMSFSFGLKRMDEARRAEATDLRKAERLYRQAVDDLTRFNRTLKPTRETLNNLGIAYAKLGIYRMVSPDNPLHTWNTAFSVERDLAMKYVSIRETDEESVAVRTTRGAKKKEAKEVWVPREMKQAIKQFKAALHRSPEYQKARMNLALCYLAISKLEDAERELALLKAGPSVAQTDVDNLRGVVRAEAGKTDEAVSAFRSVIDSRAPMPQATFNLAKVYERAGKRKDARKTYEAFLQLESTGPWADSARRSLSGL